jgi:hypothetical protein
MQDLQHLVDLRFQVGEVASIDKLSELWEIDKTAYGEASLSWEADYDIPVSTRYFSIRTRRDTSVVFSRYWIVAYQG